MRSKAEKIIHALKGCQQFQGAVAGPGVAINVLTGTRVEALPQGENEDETDAFLRVTSPGGEPFEVVGELYLELQVRESVRIEIDLGKHAAFPDSVARLAIARMAHLRGKYEL